MEALADELGPDTTVEQRFALMLLERIESLEDALRATRRYDADRNEFEDGAEVAWTAGDPPGAAALSPERWNTRVSYPPAGGSVRLRTAVFLLPGDGTERTRDWSVVDAPRPATVGALLEVVHRRLAMPLDPDVDEAYRAVIGGSAHGDVNARSMLDVVRSTGSEFRFAGVASERGPDGRPLLAVRWTVSTASPRGLDFVEGFG